MCWKIPCISCFGHNYCFSKLKCPKINEISLILDILNRFLLVYTQILLLYHWFLDIFTVVHWNISKTRNQHVSWDETSQFRFIPGILSHFPIHNSAKKPKNVYEHSIFGISQSDRVNVWKGGCTPILFRIWNGRKQSGWLWGPGKRKNIGENR